MLFLYTTLSCSTAGEVISTALYCKHWSYSPGERSCSLVCHSVTAHIELICNVFFSTFFWQNTTLLNIKISIFYVRVTVIRWNNQWHMVQICIIEVGLADCAKVPIFISELLCIERKILQKLSDRKSVV